MEKKVALGSNATTPVGVIAKPESNDIRGRLNVLEAKLDALNKAFFDIMKTPSNNAYAATPLPHVANPNMDGLPIGEVLEGMSKGIIYLCRIERDRYDTFPVFGRPLQKHASLSAAAEAVSGVRRSGWTFWKTGDGMSVKDAYGKR